MSHERSKARIVVELLCFLIGAFVPFIALGMIGAKAGGLAQAPWVTPLGMLLPMLSAFIVQKLVARQRIFGADGLGFRLGRLRWWFLAPAGFAVFIALTAIASVALTPDLLVPVGQIPQRIAHHIQLIPNNLELSQRLALAFAITLFAGPVLNLPIFLGEEVGWRGFMNPRLRTLFGKSGLIVGGIIWALWHLPVILIGHNYPHHPWLGTAIWIPICICLNILLEAVRTASKSIFPCALAHGVLNQLAMLISVLFLVEDRYIDIVHGPAGLVGLGVLLVPAALTYKYALAARPVGESLSPRRPVVRAVPGSAGWRPS